MYVEQVLLSALIFGLMLCTKASNREEVFLYRKTNTRHYVAGCILIVLFHPLLNAIAVRECAMHTVVASTRTKHHDIENGFLQIFIVTMIRMSIVTPLLEELFFRGFLLHYLKRKLPQVSAVLIGSTVFGLLHIAGSSVFNATLSGIMFSFLAISSRSIFPGILAHGVGNAIGLLERTIVLKNVQPPSYIVVIGSDEMFRYSGSVIVICSISAIITLMYYLQKPQERLTL